MQQRELTGKMRCTRVPLQTLVASARSNTWCSHGGSRRLQRSGGDAGRGVGGGSMRGTSRLNCGLTQIRPYQLDSHLFSATALSGSKRSAACARTQRVDWKQPSVSVKCLLPPTPPTPLTITSERCCACLSWEAWWEQRVSV